MSDLIKYPKWQPEYLAAVMESDVTQLPEKVHLAEAAIFYRYQVLSSSDGTDSSDELKALTQAAEALRVLTAKRLNHPDWK